MGAFTPESTSIQHAVIGSALNSLGGIGTQTQGFFHGLVDEVRIWNYARSHGRDSVRDESGNLRRSHRTLRFERSLGTVVGNTAGPTVGTAVAARRLGPPAIPSPPIRYRLPPRRIFSQLLATRRLHWDGHRMASRILPGTTCIAERRAPPSARRSTASRCSRVPRTSIRP